MMWDNAVLTLLWVVICVVVILALAYWAARYVALHSQTGVYAKNAGGGDLTVLSRLALGKEQQLVLVKAGERYFLLGVTTAQITMLAEFTQQEAAAWQSTQDLPPAEAPANFGKVLRSILQQKDRR